jgi:hypothetical protein
MLYTYSPYKSGNFEKRRRYSLDSEKMYTSQKYKFVTYVSTYITFTDFDPRPYLCEYELFNLFGLKIYNSSLHTGTYIRTSDNFTESCNILTME